MQTDLSRYDFVNKQGRAAANVELVTDPELTGYHAVGAAENGAITAGLEGKDYVIFVASFLHETLKINVKLHEPKPVVVKKVAAKQAVAKKKGEPTKSDRIRELAAQGMSKSQIVKETGFSYQFIYQVLSKEVKSQAAASEAAA